MNGYRPYNQHIQYGSGNCLYHMGIYERAEILKQLYERREKNEQGI